MPPDVELYGDDVFIMPPKNSRPVTLGITERREGRPIMCADDLPHMENCGNCKWWMRWNSDTPPPASRACARLSHARLPSFISMGSIYTTDDFACNQWEAR